MHLYKSFFRLLKRNPTGILIYLGIFIAMLVLLMTISRVDTGTSAEFNSSAKISYVDNDDSALSRGLIEYLSANNELTDLEGKSESSILDIVFFGITNYHMTIEDGFGEAVGRGETEGPAKIRYNTDFEMSAAIYGIDASVNNYINAYLDYRTLGYSDEEAADKAVKLLKDESKVSIVSGDKPETAAGDELVIAQMNQFFCYLSLGFLSLGVGHTIIANNEVNVGKRIDASPVSRKKISFANTAGLITSGIALWIIFMLINVIFGHNTQVFTQYWWVIAVNSLLATLVNCAIASVITAFNITSNSLSMITNIVTLSMSFISGVFVPQWLLGESVLRVARFLPFYWAVYANNMTYSASGVAFDMNELLMCFGVQVLFAVVLALAAAFIKSSRASRV